MVSMIGKTSAEDKNVIKVDDDKFINEWFENLIHHPHKSAWGVGKPRWHDQPLKKPISCFKGSLPLIAWTDTYLMVPTKKIDF